MAVQETSCQYGLGWKNLDLASISTAGAVQQQQHNSLKYISNVAARRNTTAKFCLQLLGYSCYAAHRIHKDENRNGGVSGFENKLDLCQSAIKIQWLHRTTSL